MKSHRVRSSALAQPLFAIALVAVAGVASLTGTICFGGESFDPGKTIRPLPPGDVELIPKPVAPDPFGGYVRDPLPVKTNPVPNLSTIANIVTCCRSQVSCEFGTYVIPANITAEACANWIKRIIPGGKLPGKLDAFLNKLLEQARVGGWQYEDEILNILRPDVRPKPVTPPVGAGGTTLGKFTQVCVRAVGTVSTAMTVYDFAKGTLDLAEQHFAWKERQVICQSKKPFWESSAGDFEMNEVPPEDYCTKYKAFQEACKSTGSGLDLGGSEGGSSGDYTAATYPYKVQKLDLLCSMPRPSNTAVACDQGAVNLGCSMEGQSCESKPCCGNGQCGDNGGSKVCFPE